MEIEVNDPGFEKEVLGSSLPVLVDFWAAWCGPCMLLGPTVSHIARHFAGKLKVCKLNVDMAPETAQKYSIQSIPTLIVFKDGKEQERIVGVIQQMELEDALKQYITC